MPSQLIELIIRVTTGEELLEPNNITNKEGQAVSIRTAEAEKVFNTTNRWGLATLGRRRQLQRTRTGRMMDIVIPKRIQWLTRVTAAPIHRTVQFSD